MRDKKEKAAYDKKRREDNPEKDAARHKKYYEANKKERAAYSKKYYEANKEKKKIYQEERKEKITKYQTKYQKKYRAKHKKEIATYFRNRWANNHKYRLDKNISRAIGESLNGNKAGRSWEVLVGYTLDDLTKRIEKQFTPGMTWKNYGDWHIDHIIPKVHFNYTTAEHIDFKRCWALKNLQPLWSEDNMKNHCKLNKPFQLYLPI